MMNIYAEEGHKVIVTEESSRKGYDYNKEVVERYLEIGKVYTVEKTIIGGWHTDVYLKEVPSILFNSVNFEDYEEGGKKYLGAVKCDYTDRCMHFKELCGNCKNNKLIKTESFYEPIRVIL